VTRYSPPLRGVVTSVVVPEVMAHVGQETVTSKIYCCCVCSRTLQTNQRDRCQPYLTHLQPRYCPAQAPPIITSANPALKLLTLCHFVPGMLNQTFKMLRHVIPLVTLRLVAGHGPFWQKAELINASNLAPRLLVVGAILIKHGRQSSPKATELLRGSEMTRYAKSCREQVPQKIAIEGQLIRSPRRRGPGTLPGSLDQAPWRSANSRPART
jgi:hypothetical protein